MQVWQQYKNDTEVIDQLDEVPLLGRIVHEFEHILFALHHQPMNVVQQTARLHVSVFDLGQEILYIFQWLNLQHNYYTSPSLKTMSQKC